MLLKPLPEKMKNSHTDLGHLSVHHLKVFWKQELFPEPSKYLVGSVQLAVQLLFLNSTEFHLNHAKTFRLPQSVCSILQGCC
ncbi:hypothetical protein GDO81_000621 [Engystomops pustulosus]|uniref:Uncharacterized protein n=1 Tax=Engystomops pustulosus TaxID=76066 RepID=A0AAV7D7P3_ENGPU|nr:hypothetical protein GDO81_000621 [Engystomops pustulosus]